MLSVRVHISKSRTEHKDERGAARLQPLPAEQQLRRLRDVRGRPAGAQRTEVRRDILRRETGDGLPLKSQRSRAIPLAARQGRRQYC